ncbi:hypothetical protein TNCV_1593761 [Trichonephila clavipes]|nr:hypothetical protein TNCV_1593761 [Trichonephila clavipes]
MDVLKSLNGWSKRLYWAHGVPLDLGSLAWNAASWPFSKVLQHGRPDEAVLDEALRGTNARMREIMERAKYFKVRSSSCI